MNIKHVSAIIEQNDGEKTRKTWICTRCTTNDVKRNHMCHDCEQEHNGWLRELSKPKLDDDQWHTLYESGGENGR